MKNILNKCPICGSKLQYCRHMSFTLNSMVKRNGELSVKETKSPFGSLESGFIACINEDCDFITDDDLRCANHRNIKIILEDNKFYYEETYAED